MSSSPLHQLQLSYDQFQDRLVLSLSTQDFCEYRFWITRRMLKGLWNILMQLLKADQKGQLQHMRENQEVASKIQQEKSQHQPMADKLSQKITRLPLGEEPLLLAKMMAKPGDSGIFFLHLEDAKGHSIEFGGDSKLIVALSQLILQTIKSTDWDLSLEMDERDLRDKRT